MKNYLIMTSSTSNMLKGDNLLKENSINTVLVPAPKEYGSVCAIAIRVSEQDLEKSKELLKSHDVNVEGIYEDLHEKLDNIVKKLKDKHISLEFKEITKSIEEGKELAYEDVLYLLKTDRPAEQEALFELADEMRKKVVGDVVDIRGAIEFSNYCIKDCNYCGLRKDNLELERYRMSEDEILEIVNDIKNMGLKTVILQSGEDPHYTKEIMGNILKRIKNETGLKITLSIGERELEEYEYFKSCGADNYLLKIETTNKAIFDEIHPDGDMENRLKCIQKIKSLGYLNGNGAIIGLPMQKEEDIAKDIMFFKDMGINMIGIGPFVPAKNTPYENLPHGDVRMTLKAVAVTRLVCQRVFIPATTALLTVDRSAQAKALISGANSLMLVNTPETYRENYVIYSNKSEVGLDYAIESIKEAGRKLPLYLTKSKEV
ncbi:biotin synthase [Acetoanaerobium pronyense]|uniref:Biotin synthase n=1 Tax=Acetoanaerobium pronyense TaxID=1482736 RepID=A0ABS4KJD6_9FIRM|nr:[FeFe] hydrogenase H-cluster radical SAM maturase HydE [Acetoanaerobium pronyense]MBP2027892.1 biotin synthase [Acetoanaerobium pronyense]